MLLYNSCSGYQMSAWKAAFGMSKSAILLTFDKARRTIERRFLRSHPDFRVSLVLSRLDTTVLAARTISDRIRRSGP